MADHGPTRPGELNYVISVICDAYMREVWDGVTYQAVNDVVGVLECAKLEIYRRLAAPYEDKKQEVNGDVYTV